MFNVVFRSIAWVEAGESRNRAVNFLKLVWVYSAIELVMYVSGRVDVGRGWNRGKGGQPLAVAS